MTGTAVVGVVTLADGQPCVGARVTAEVVSDGEMVSASNGQSVVAPVAALTSGDGSWLMRLEPNIDLSPAGTVWKVVVKPPDRQPTSFTIEVPATTRTQNVTDLLVSPGLVRRTLLGGSVLSPFSRGAYGDGLTDDTVAVQAAVNDAESGQTVDGGGKTYVVSSVQLKSDITFQNFRFLTKAGTVNGVSPVTIGAYGDNSTVQNVIIRNVHVDGQRSAQTSISGSEDGARHGFRFIGHISNIRMADCSASYCATDGLVVYSGIDITKSATEGVAQDVVVERCDFTYNRRHGVSIDALERGRFVDCTFSHNGTDIGESEGELGITDFGSIYGNGVDLEEYDVDTFDSDIRFVRCSGAGNARAAILIYTGPNRADDPDWVVRSRFDFIDCDLSAGTDPSGNGYCVEITPDASVSDTGVFFSDVRFRGCRLDGAVNLRCVDGARFESCSIAGGLINAGNLVNVSNLTVDACDLGAKLFGNQPSIAESYMPGRAVLHRGLAVRNPVTVSSISTAGATVDRTAFLRVNQTVAGQTLTLPTPSKTTDAVVVIVSNVGSESFTMAGAYFAVGQTRLAVWDPVSTAWRVT